jgi:ECF transporter S component (folate family)
VPVGREVAAGRKIFRDLRCSLRIPLPQEGILFLPVTISRQLLMLKGQKCICHSGGKEVPMKNTRVFVFSGLLIAMNVILTHMLGLMITPTIRVSFGFLPVAFTSMLFGPIVGSVAAAAGDVIGALSFPQGQFFPGFTLSAFLGGAIYAFFLYKKPKTILRIALAVLCISLVVDAGLNTFWLTILYGKGFFILLPGGLVKIALMFPIQTAMIYTVRHYAGNIIEKDIVRNRA